MDSELRRSTLKFSFSFGVSRPQILEFDMWFFGKFKVPEEDVIGLQYDFLSNTFHVKLRKDDDCNRIMTLTSGTAEYHHNSGEVSNVNITYDGLGIRSVKVYNLPFEISYNSITDVLSKYGTVYAITSERWSGNMHYKVDNGVRVARIDLRSHIPSFITVRGFKALVVYEGQPRTCSVCNSPEHLRAECTRRRPVQLPASTADATGAMQSLPLSYARVAGTSVSHKEPDINLVMTPKDIINEGDKTTSTSPSDKTFSPIAVENINQSVSKSVASTTVTSPSLELENLQSIASQKDQSVIKISKESETGETTRKPLVKPKIANKEKQNADKCPLSPEKKKLRTTNSSAIDTSQKNKSKTDKVKKKSKEGADEVQAPTDEFSEKKMETDMISPIVGRQTNEAWWQDSGMDGQDDNSSSVDV